MKAEYSRAPAGSGRCTTRFRGRARDDRSYDFGVGYRDETTDASRSRNFQVAATRSENRWHGFTRTIGLKYLDGDFEIGQDDDNLEYGNSKLLFAEGTLSRRRLNDRLAPRKGYVLEFGARLASEALVSDTDIAQACGRITWLLPQGEHGRFKFRGEVGAMTVGNFDALPPDLRFYAGGDRSIARLRLSRHRRSERQRQHHRRQIPGHWQRRVRVLLQRELGCGGVRRRG